MERIFAFRDGDNVVVRSCPFCKQQHTHSSHGFIQTWGARMAGCCPQFTADKGSSRVYYLLDGDAMADDTNSQHKRKQQ